MLFCYRYLGNYQKADIMWSAYCKKSSLQYDIVNISLYITSMRYIWKHRINS